MQVKRRRTTKTYLLENKRSSPALLTDFFEIPATLNDSLPLVQVKHKQSTEL